MKVRQRMDVKRLGIDSQVAAKTTRYADGASVMEHVRKVRGNEIGIGAITGTFLAHDQGVQFAGPLPEALQNYTAYEASATKAVSKDVDSLMQHLASQAARAGDAAAGIGARQ